MKGAKIFSFGASTTRSSQWMYCYHAGTWGLIEYFWFVLGSRLIHSSRKTAKRIKNGRHVH